MSRAQKSNGPPSVGDGGFIVNSLCFLTGVLVTLFTVGQASLDVRRAYERTSVRTADACAASCTHMHYDSSSFDPSVESCTCRVLDPSMRYRGAK